MLGSLIVFEGIDGSGKTTQVAHLKKYLLSRDFPALFLKEPRRDSKYGKELERLIRQGIRKEPKEEYELFQRDREENVRENIIPALEDGKIVVMDRYYFSTIAYQGARGIDTLQIEADNVLFAPLPKLVFFLDIEPSLAVERIAKRINRIKDENVFEKEDYLRAVKSVFDSIKKPFIHKVDATMSEKEVFIEILEIIQEQVLDHYE